MTAHFCFIRQSNLSVCAETATGALHCRLKKEISAQGKKIFFIHGHPYYVKHGYERIEEEAKNRGADICLFGHTHIPYTEYKDGIYFMNPGAVFNGSYGIIDITDSGIMTYNLKI